MIKQAVHSVFNWLMVMKITKGQCYAFLIAFFLSPLIYAQELSATLNHQRVQLGEPVELKMVAKLAPNSKISFEPAQHELTAFIRQSQVNEKSISLELTQAFSDTTLRVNNEYTWVGYYHFIAWDTGRIVIPMQHIVINDSTFLFNEVNFTVSGQTVGVKDELFDIEEGFSVVPEPLSIKEVLMQYGVYIGLGLLAVGLALWYWKKKKDKKQRPVKALSLKERTLFAITELEKQRLWEKNKLKQHYTELSHIIRSYLSSRYQLNLLERTTFETKTLLQQTDMSVNAIQTTMELLSQADMVKFANATIDETIIRAISEKAIQLVIETSPFELTAINEEEA